MRLAYLLFVCFWLSTPVKAAPPEARPSMQLFAQHYNAFLKDRLGVELKSLVHSGARHSEQRWAEVMTGALYGYTRLLWVLAQQSLEKTNPRPATWAWDLQRLQPLQVLELYAERVPRPELARSIEALVQELAEETPFQMQWQEQPAILLVKALKQAQGEVQNFYAGPKWDTEQHPIGLLLQQSLKFFREQPAPDEKPALDLLEIFELQNRVSQAWLEKV